MTTELATSDPPPQDRVPVDERVLGFDRRTILPGVIALAMWFTWAHVLPWVDEQIDFDNPVVAGDVIDLGEGELTMVPAVGWNREAGLLVGEDSQTGTPWPTVAGTGADALVALPEIGFEVSVRIWDGTADELLDQLLDTSDTLDEIAFEDVQDRVAFANVDGVPGVLAPYSSSEEDGFIAAYTMEVEVPASGEDAEPTTLNIGIAASATSTATADVSDDEARQVVDMLASIRYRPTADGEEDGS